jgi:hypothetical protein
MHVTIHDSCADVMLAGTFPECSTGDGHPKNVPDISTDSVTAI